MSTSSRQPLERTCDRLGPPDVRPRSPNASNSLSEPSPTVDSRRVSEAPDHSEATDHVITTGPTLTLPVWGSRCATRTVAWSVNWSDSTGQVVADPCPWALRETVLRSLEEEHPSAGYDLFAEADFYRMATGPG